MFSPDLHIVISDLHIQVIRREMLDIQVDCELVPVRSHLQIQRQIQYSYCLCSQCLSPCLCDGTQLN